MPKRIHQWRVEVAIRKEFPDPIGRSILQDIRDLGVQNAGDIRVAHVFLITGPLTRRDINRISARLLCDPVNQTYSFDGPLTSPGRGEPKIIQVFKKPGVMDPVAMSTLKGIADLGLSARNLRTGHKYFIYGDLSRHDLALISDKVLHNPAIEETIFGNLPVEHSPESPRYQFQRREISILGVSDKRLMQISADMTLSLNLQEMHTIQSYFAELGRNPADVELETLAQTWSEHCVHKTLKGVIRMDGCTIDNLLKTTIARVTRELDKPWCVSVFVDNAGIIAFDGDVNVCFKVETHNHPSAIEPYGGAGTGIGGVIRDTLGTGLGARPIANTDIFCFARPTSPDTKSTPAHSIPNAS